jgi:acyl carrier protein
VSRGKTSQLPDSSFVDLDYFAAGWLTSMEVVEFVTEIEHRFGIQFSDGDLQDPRFVTIGGMTELILARSTSSRENI